MTIDLSELFRLTFGLILLIGVPLLVVQLYIVFRKVSSVLDDVKIISSKSAEVAEDKEAVQQFTQEVMSYTANDVIETQTHNISRKVADGLVKMIKRPRPIPVKYEGD